MNAEDWIVVAVAMFFASLFGAIFFILRFVAGVTWRLDFKLGRPLRRSWLGTGAVNEVSCRGMLQVVEYADGWLIRVHPTFIFGVMWLPKDKTTIDPLQPGGWFYPKSLRLDFGSDCVILNGHLADFVAKSFE